MEDKKLETTRGIIIFATISISGSFSVFLCQSRCQRACSIFTNQAVPDMTFGGIGRLPLFVLIENNTKIQAD